MADFNLRSAESVVLLGAGASVEAGLPSSNQLTEHALQERESDSDEIKWFRQLYRVIAAAILFRASKNGSNPLRLPVNVEHVAEALGLLAQHEHWRFGDIFGSVDPAILDIEGEFDSHWRQELLKKRITEVLNADGSKQRILADILASEIAGRNRRIQGFYSQASEALQEMCFNILANPTKPFDYMEPLVKCRRVRAVATLNFDTLFEQACLKSKRDHDVGVFDWSRGKLAFRPTSIPLLKLHGSIDWCSWNDPDEADENGRPGGPERVTQGTPNHGWFADRRPCVLFGTASKLQASGPFLDLLRRFEAELAEVSRVAVIGYSFSDEHINEILASWLRRDKMNRMSIASTARFFDSWIDRDLFFQEWSKTQVEVTTLGASEAIALWC